MGHRGGLALRVGMGIVAAAVALLPAVCAGADEPKEMPFARLAPREYVRGNTWNGCVSYGHADHVFFREWACPHFELAAAVAAADHFVRYRHHVAPLGPEAFAPSRVISNGMEVVTCRMPVNAFEPLRPPNFDIDGADVRTLERRVLPFRVQAPSESPVDLRCVLVGFFREEKFCFAVYYCVNNGRAAMDFHDLSTNGYMLVADQSRYPYLTRDECRTQEKVIVDHFLPPEKRPKLKPAAPLRPEPEVVVDPAAL